MDHQAAVRRRTFVKGGAALLGSLALRGYAIDSEASAYFTHGVASGDPMADRVILWTRVLPSDGAAKALEGRWQVSADPDFRNIVSEGSAYTGPERDNTVKVDATGLEPGQTYYYRFLFHGQTSAVGRTRTLPEGDVAQFRIGICSCSNYPQGYFNAYRDMAEADLDAVMHLGDYIYEYAADIYANPKAVQQLGRQVVPSHEIVALEDYRQRYGLYRTDPDLQAAHAAHPWICVWDDHELANDTWRGGAENHNEGEGDFETRIAMARKAYHEWLPIRTPAQSDQKPIYRSFKVGQLADLIMLDTRLQGRDQQLSYQRDLVEGGLDPETFRRDVLNNPERTMLGQEQADWLANQLKASRERGATWQFLGQQVLMGKLMLPVLPEDSLNVEALPERTRRWIGGMMAIAKANMPLNLDAWDGYPACRDRVFANLLALASNPVVVAGDTHNAWAFNLRNEAGQAVGIEVGCPGISSPGLESYLPIPPEQMMAALRESSPELVALDTYRRGWAVVTLTPSATMSAWRFVDTVLDKRFTVTETPTLVCEVGQRQFTST